MIMSPSFSLDTDDLKQAIIDFINNKLNEEYKIEEINNFSVSKSNDDIRVYVGYISFNQKDV